MGACLANSQSPLACWPFAPRLAEHTHHGAACQCPPLALAPPGDRGLGCSRPGPVERLRSISTLAGLSLSSHPAHRCPLGSRPPARPRHVNGLAVIDPARPSSASAWLLVITSSSRLPLPIHPPPSSLSLTRTRPVNRALPVRHPPQTVPSNRLSHHLVDPTYPAPRSHPSTHRPSSHDHHDHHDHHHAPPQDQVQLRRLQGRRPADIRRLRLLQRVRPPLPLPLHPRTLD